MQLKGSGVNDKKKLAIAGALGLAVVLLAVHTLFGGPDTPTPVPNIPIRHTETLSGPTGTSAVSAPTTSAQANADAGGPGSSAAKLDPTLHPELMAETESYVYAGTGRNIFSRDAAPIVTPQQAIEKVKAPIRPSMNMAAAVPAGPPPPPPIDLRFFGYSQRHNGTRKAFLLHGEEPFIASEGDIVSHRYRVVQISPTSIQIEDLPYHNTQTLQLVHN